MPPPDAVNSRCSSSVVAALSQSQRSKPNFATFAGASSEQTPARQMRSPSDRGWGMPWVPLSDDFADRALHAALSTNAFRLVIELRIWSARVGADGTVTSDAARRASGIPLEEIDAALAELESKDWVALTDGRIELLKPTGIEHQWTEAQRVEREEKKKARSRVHSATYRENKKNKADRQPDGQPDASAMTSGVTVGEERIGSVRQKDAVKEGPSTTQQSSESECKSWCHLDGPSPQCPIHGLTSQAVE